MAVAHRLSSRLSNPLIARSRLRSASPAIISTLLRSEASASSNVPRICFGGVISIQPSSESSGNIIFRSALGRIRENFCGRPNLDHLAEVKKGVVLGAPPGLWHVMGHDPEGGVCAYSVGHCFNLRGGIR